MYYTYFQTESISDCMLSLVSFLNKYKQRKLWVKNILKCDRCPSSIKQQNKQFEILKLFSMWGESTQPHYSILAIVLYSRYV